MHGGMATHSASATLLFPVVAGAAATTAPACPPSTLSKSTATSRPSRGHPRRRRQSLSCSATGADDDGNSSSSRSRSRLWLPRRDVLAGLTGVAAGLTAYPGAGLAQLAEVYKCNRGDSKVTDDRLGCDVFSGLPCPPRPGKDVEVVDFVPPKYDKLRVRRPAHALSQKEISGYRKALAKMRAAPTDDPSSFAQQAAIHDAYCDGHYHVDPTERNRAFDVDFVKRMIYHMYFGSSYHGDTTRTGNILCEKGTLSSSKADKVHMFAYSAPDPVIPYPS